MLDLSYVPVGTSDYYYFILFSFCFYKVMNLSSKIFKILQIF